MTSYPRLAARATALRDSLLLPALTFACLTLICATAVSQHAARPQTMARFNPVITGDHPDPSIIRVGSTYWTASTSGDWSPQFALFKSTDLQHWVAAGSVFPVQPEWATGSFWAPELVSDGGRVLVYYVARKRGGPLCVAVGTAARPEGPYTDQGPMVCQPDGSIDPAFARDETGQPFLIWKEDGNSENKLTPLWAQHLTADLVHLTGEKTQLFANEPTSWEGNVVEAPYVMRHGGHFFMFYAANACCGNKCNYAEGVARAEHLLGPWEKNLKNPIIRPNENWRCPGHGSAVTTPTGEEFFMYHAYPAKGTIYLGRESVLDRITWGADGWPAINSDRGPSGALGHPYAVQVSDSFSGASLDNAWRWPVNRQPKIGIGGRGPTGGKLVLTLETEPEEFVARSIVAPDYTAAVQLDQAGKAAAALGVIGNAKHLTGASRRGDVIEVWRESDQGRVVLWNGKLASVKPGSRAETWVRVKSTGGTSLAYSFGRDGKHWTPAGPPLDVTTMPQWDQGLRVGLIATGSPGESATFRHFSMHTDTVGSHQKAR